MDPIEECIQNMERQIINDDLKRRVVPMDLLPPEVQQAVIEEINRKKLQHEPTQKEPTWRKRF